jgi:hypothetical protein
VQLVSVLSLSSISQLPVSQNLLKGSSNLMKAYKKPPPGGPPGAGKRGASDDGLDAELGALEDDDDLDDDEDEDDDPEIRVSQYTAQNRQATPLSFVNHRSSTLTYLTLTSTMTCTPPNQQEMTRNAKLLLQQHQGEAAKKESLSASQPAATGGQRQPNAGASDVLRVENLRLKYALAAQMHTTNNDQVKAAACHEVGW